MTLYASNRPDAGPTNADTVVINPVSAATDAGTHDPLHNTVLAWLDQHPDLLVKYSDGTGWWMTTQARRETTLAWFALVEKRGDGQLTITPAGRRIGHRYTELAEPRVITARLAAFADGTLLNQLLDEAIHDALAVADQTRRTAVATHRGARPWGRLATRVRRRLAGWTR